MKYQLIILLGMMPFIDFMLYHFITRICQRPNTSPMPYRFIFQHWLLGNIGNYVFISWLSVSHVAWDIPSLQNVILQMILYFVVVDLVFFILHFTCHRLWYEKIHRLHHICKPLQSSCTRNSHWIDAFIENSSFTLPFCICEYNGFVAYACLIFNAVWIGNLHNGDMIDGLNTFFIQPSHHTIHHQYNGKQSFNYAIYFTIWDRMFQTFRTCSRYDSCIVR